MKLSKLYLFAILILCLPTFTHAQDETEGVFSEDYNRIETATRVHEFGKLSQTDRMSRLDYFLIELQNNPGSTGYIVFYQGKDVLPSQYGVTGEQLYRDHLRFKNYDENGTVFVNAFRERQTTEFWVVPAGGILPALTLTIPEPAAPKNESFIYHRTHFDLSADDFLLPSVIDQRELAKAEYARDNGDDAIISAEPEAPVERFEKSPAEINYEEFCRAGHDFAAKIKDSADKRGVVIFYADDKMFDVKKVGDDVRRRVSGTATEAGASADRFEVIFGGYRNGIEIEMWIVPKTAKSPAAKPAERRAEIY